MRGRDHLARGGGRRQELRSFKEGGVDGTRSCPARVRGAGRQSGRSGPSAGLTESRTMVRTPVRTGRGGRDSNAGDGGEASARHCERFGWRAHRVGSRNPSNFEASRERFAGFRGSELRTDGRRDGARGPRRYTAWSDRRCLHSVGAARGAPAGAAALQCLRNRARTTASPTLAGAAMTKSRGPRARGTRRDQQKLAINGAHTCPAHAPLGRMNTEASAIRGGARRFAGTDSHGH